MRGSLVIRAVAVAVALLVGGSAVRGDDREDRDRKARAALALTAPSAPAKSAAPKPRDVGTEYATAYARALDQSKPLVVYVACKADHKAPGAVASKADSLPGVKGPAAVVMYPRGDGMLVHRVMQCPVDDAELGKAIKEATSKLEGKAKGEDKPAPKPLDWQIRADTERDARTELDYAMDSAARIRSGDAWGSGVVVFAEPGRSVILTANHILKPGQPVEVRAAGRNLEGRVILTDTAADLAAVEVARELPHVAVVDDELAEGDDVLLVGAASVWSRGKASGFVRHNDREVAVFTYDSYSGDSGGAVFRRGLVVGIHTGGHAGRKTAARNLVAFTAKAIRVEAPKGTPAAVVQPGPKPAALPDCPNGKCALPSPFAGPVIQGGCANGQCEAPSYGRGFFRRR
jgi:S1-C subfamily serine protease